MTASFEQRTTTKSLLLCLGGIVSSIVLVGCSQSNPPYVQPKTEIMCDDLRAVCKAAKDAEDCFAYERKRLKENCKGNAEIEQKNIAEEKRLELQKPELEARAKRIFESNKTLQNDCIRVFKAGMNDPSSFESASSFIFLGLSAGFSVSDELFTAVKDVRGRNPYGGKILGQLYCAFSTKGGKARVIQSSQKPPFKLPPSEAGYIF